MNRWNLRMIRPIFLCLVIDFSLLRSILLYLLENNKNTFNWTVERMNHSYIDDIDLNQVLE